MAKSIMLSCIEGILSKVKTKIVKTIIIDIEYFINLNINFELLYQLMVICQKFLVDKWKF